MDKNGEKPVDDASSNYYKLVSYNSLDLQSEQHTINSLATEIGDMVVEKSADAAASVFWKNRNIFQNCLLAVVHNQADVVLTALLERVALWIELTIPTSSCTCFYRDYDELSKCKAQVCTSYAKGGKQFTAKKLILRQSSHTSNAWNCCNFEQPKAGFQ